MPNDSYHPCSQQMQQKRPRSRSAGSCWAELRDRPLRFNGLWFECGRMNMLEMCRRSPEFASRWGGSMQRRVGVFCRSLSAALSMPAVVGFQLLKVDGSPAGVRGGRSHRWAKAGSKLPKGQQLVEAGNGSSALGLCLPPSARFGVARAGLRGGSCFSWVGGRERGGSRRPSGAG